MNSLFYVLGAAAVFVIKSKLEGNLPTDVPLIS